MKLQTVFKTALCCMTLMTAGNAFGQATQFHGDQYNIIGGGQALINKTVSSQTDKMTKIALEEGVQGGEFLIIKGWEAKYNSYLKSTQGYAESLKAATTLFAEGVVTLRNLYAVTQAVEHNPQGLISTAVMNNLYVEAASDLLKTYDVLKYSVSMGTEKNMLTGAQRTELMFLVSDQLHVLNKKLRRLAVSLAFYNLKDVWYHATSGLIETDKKYWAEYAYDKWRRAAKDMPSFRGWRIPLTFRGMTFE